MIRTIQIHRTGGTEVLEATDLPPAPLQSGQIRLKQTVIAFNYVDVYLRQAVYPIALPATLGVEAVGIVTEVAPDVADFSIGDRAAYTYQTGAYAAERVVDAALSVRLPDDIDDDTAAAVLFKGQTAHMLLTQVRPISAGDVMLVQSAAGGVGQMLTRWGKALGAKVLATVGQADKQNDVLMNGADAVFVRDGSMGTQSDFIRHHTREGADVIFDAVGRETWAENLKSLRPFGLLASYGLASGEIDPIDPKGLSRAGSLFFIRASVNWTLSHPQTYREAAEAVFQQIRAGVLKPAIAARFPLEEVAAAHALAESRTSSGSILLYP